MNKDTKGTVKANDGRKIIESQGWISVRKEHRMAHPPYVCNVLGFDDLLIKEHEKPMLAEYCTAGDRMKHKKPILARLAKRPWLYDQFLIVMGYYYSDRKVLKKDSKGRKRKGEFRKSGWHFEILMREYNYRLIESQQAVYTWHSIDWDMGVS